MGNNTEGRRYTVREIEALRQAESNQYLYGTYGQPQGNCMSRSYREDEMTRTVEERVRTDMMAGLTAEDLRGNSAALNSKEW